MPMRTTLTLTYEGPPSCADCQREGIPLCDHIGFNPESWDHVIGENVNAPGLDAAFVHTVRSVDISPDRKTLTYTVDTYRPPMLELARHLSTYTDHRAKANIQAVHHESGDELAAGLYDAFLQEGQQVYVQGVPHVVQAIDHPNRNEHGTCEDKPDLQVAKLMPTPVEPIQAVSGGTNP